MQDAEVRGLNEPAGAEHTGRPPINDRREIFGWTMYDWACSTFSTTVAGALLAPYITALAQAAVGENGVIFDLGVFGTVTAKSFFPLCISLSVFLQVFFLPVLGALADYTNLKKRLMALFCYIGAFATCCLFFVAGDRYLLGGVLFIIANLSFGAATVFYNAFLPEIVSNDQTDRVSSRGFALGYLGGGILLALNFLLLTFADRLGISAGMAVRLSLLSAGVWWAGFALLTFQRLKARAPQRSLPEGERYLTVGFREVGRTFAELRRLPHTLRYLVGYLFFNDGIQTVIGLAAVFLSQELFTQAQRTAGEDTRFVLLIFLFVQFVAFGGALLFGRLAGRFGSKQALMLSLIIWIGIVVYAYGILQTQFDAWLMAALIALVLGGSQALSRSLFARMIPAGREASFFGIYEISERGTSWIGPLIFSVVVANTGSYRQAILSLIVLFVVGLVILLLTNTDQAIRDAAGDSDADRRP